MRCLCLLNNCRISAFSTRAQRQAIRGSTFWPRAVHSEIWLQWQKMCAQKGRRSECMIQQWSLPHSHRESSLLSPALSAWGRLHSRNDDFMMTRSRTTRRRAPLVPSTPQLRVVGGPDAVSTDLELGWDDMSSNPCFIIYEISTKTPLALSLLSYKMGRNNLLEF
jgi:hypothetical protein